MKATKYISMVLVIVGALNWGLVGLFNFDLVAALLGDGSALTRIVYTLVGLAAIGMIVVATSKSGSHNKIQTA